MIVNGSMSLDDLINGLGQSVQRRADHGSLRRWFAGRSGQHEPSCGRQAKGDLIRWDANAGLPTIRADLGDQAHKIEVRGRSLLDVVLDRLERSAHTMATLRRLTRRA